MTARLPEEDELSLSLSMRMSGGGGGGAALGAALGALYNGGLELHDGSGHLPRDVDGYYLSRGTGERLLVDDGYSQGEALGAPAVSGWSGITSVITGSPYTGRLTGFTGFDASNYVEYTIDNDEITVIALVEYTLGGNQPLQGVDGAPGLLMLMASNDWQVRAYDALALEVGRADTASSSGSATLILAGTGETDGLLGGDVGARVYNSSGTLTHSDTDTHTALALASSYYLGRNGGGTIFWSDTITELYVSDGSVLGASAIQDVVDDIVVGDDPATIVATHGLSHGTAGVICGAYDPAVPSDLFFLSGSGDAVTAEWLP